MIIDFRRRKLYAAVGSVADAVFTCIAGKQHSLFSFLNGERGRFQSLMQWIDANLIADTHTGCLSASPLAHKNEKQPNLAYLKLSKHVVPQ